jgi:uncharacterized protein YcbX
MPAAASAGRVESIWRYPVKSMLGEELGAALVTERGVLGDRAYALVDTGTGKVASAKNPRRWPTLFEFRAAFTAEPDAGKPMPAVNVDLPDGGKATSAQADIDARLSQAVGRTVRLARTPTPGAVAEGYWPDHDWLAQRDEVFEFPLPPGTFFDGATIHLVTTATLQRLRELAPASRFDVARFRANLVIAATATGFVENDWIGRTLQVGAARLRVDGPCPRCIMTTLAQGDLPKDPHVLRTAVQANSGNVGVYATVVQAGRVQRGDMVKIDPSAP